MKAVGCVVVVVVVAVAGFLGLASWILTRGDDQSALTRSVPITVIHPEKVGTGTSSGWKFAYAYRVGGRWYGYDSFFVKEDYWSPGERLDVCVDPQAPRRHVLSATEPCGQERVAPNFIREATPRPAPR